MDDLGKDKSTWLQRLLWWQKRFSEKGMRLSRRLQKYLLWSLQNSCVLNFNNLALEIIFIEPDKGFLRRKGWWPSSSDSVSLLSLPLLWESLTLITTVTLLLFLGSRELFFLFFNTNVAKTITKQKQKTFPWIFHNAVGEFQKTLYYLRTKEKLKNTR